MAKKFPEGGGESFREIETTRNDRGLKKPGDRRAQRKCFGLFLSAANADVASDFFEHVEEGQVAVTVATDHRFVHRIHLSQ